MEIAVGVLSVTVFAGFLIGLLCWQEWRATVYWAKEAEGRVERIYARIRSEADAERRRADYYKKRCGELRRELRDAAKEVDDE
jgi:hypothetical protein